MTRSATGMTALGLGLAAVFIVSLNHVGDRLLGNARFDLTDQSLFTLADGTKAILAKIDEPVTLKFYYSTHLGQVVPPYGVYAQRVEELLQEYAHRSKGKVILQILDPVPFSDIEDQATAAGLQGVPVDESGEKVYFGLVGMNSTDDRQTIPFFQTDREKFLEYDVTKLVQSLAFPKKKVIGLVTALPLDGDPMAKMQGRDSPSQAVLDQLREGFDVQDISTGFNKVPDDVDVLMIVQPQGLSDATQYAIDQWVLAGGHALVFVDPDSEFERNHPSMLRAPGGSNAAEFDRLLKAWGVELVKDKIVGDRLAARRVNTGAAGVAEYLGWLNLKGDALNHEDPIIGQLGQLNFASAGALQPLAGAKTKFEPLIQSSAESELIDTAKIQGVPDVQALLRDFKATGVRYTLAGRITGLADTAFPDGPPKSEDKTAPPSPLPAQIKTAKEPLNVVVIGDSDVLDDRFWVQVQNFFGQRVATPEANNADFVQNAVENLLGSGDLINLRSRGSAVRPFGVVDVMQRDAEDHYRTQEKTLQDKLKDTQAHLDELSAKSSSGTDQLTPEQTQAIDQFRATIIQTRQQLRQVQLALRQGIDRLKQRLFMLNVGLVALVLGVLRQTSRKRRARSV